MAFLTHSLPWHSLASMFEYSNGSGPGPQYSDLLAKNKQGQRKQAEHFARAFQATVREHSTDERKRYSTVREYQNRARTWSASQEEHDAKPTFTTVPPDAHQSVASCEFAPHKRTVAQSTLGNESSSTPSVERRRFFPPDFATTYMSYVPITSGHAYGREGLVEDFSDIETWIDFFARNAQYSSCTEGERNRLWLDRKSCCDILRLLIIDAASTTNAGRRGYEVETMMLQIHHSKMDMRAFLDDGMSCCNVAVGITALVKKVAMTFVYLNLLYSFIDGKPGSALLRLHDELEKHEPAYYRRNQFVSLLPRPAYMNMRSYDYLLAVVLQEHGHVVEHVFFNPLFAPYASGRCSRYLRLGAETQAAQRLGDEDKRHERDIFADLQKLKEALKQMWKVLVYCDMLFAESRRPINWEYVTLNTLSDLFRGTGGIERLLGQDWTSYDADRMVNEGFSFYAVEKRSSAAE